MIFVITKHEEKGRRARWSQRIKRDQKKDQDRDEDGKRILDRGPVLESGIMSQIN